MEATIDAMPPRFGTLVEFAAPADPRPRGRGGDATARRGSAPRAAWWRVAFRRRRAGGDPDRPPRSGSASTSTRAWPSRCSAKATRRRAWLQERIDAG
jgi:hypothetical protein